MDVVRNSEKSLIQTDVVDGKCRLAVAFQAVDFLTSLCARLLSVHDLTTSQYWDKIPLSPLEQL
jgi:hypothetical protein